MKKVICLILSLVFMLSVCMSASALNKFVLGGANKDGSVSVMDATTIQLYLVGKYTADADFIARSDTDGDKEISVLDATKIQLLIAQIIDHFPGEDKEPDYDSSGYYDQIVKP